MYIHDCIANAALDSGNHALARQHFHATIQVCALSLRVCVDVCRDWCGTARTGTTPRWSSLHSRARTAPPPRAMWLQPSPATSGASLPAARCVQYVTQTHLKRHGHSHGLLAYDICFMQQREAALGADGGAAWDVRLGMALSQDGQLASRFGDHQVPRHTQQCGADPVSTPENRSPRPATLPDASARTRGTEWDVWLAPVD